MFRRTEKRKWTSFKKEPSREKKKRTTPVPSKRKELKNAVSSDSAKGKRKKKKGFPFPQLSGSKKNPVKNRV